MMFGYDHLLCVRHEAIDGLSPWIWIKEDSGAWDGPKMDWNNHHRKTIEYHCKEKRVAVQAGGCQGMYPRLLSQMFQMVYTFEPDPLSFHCLVANCQQDNIIKIQSALGREPALIHVQRSPDPRNVGMHTVKPGGAIPQLPVDWLRLEICDLLMLDVEGYEVGVLEGAHETLTRCRPMIFAERGDHLIHILAKYGYEKLGESAMDTVFDVPNK
jgi:FkbM family methyltransferase